MMFSKQTTEITCSDVFSGSKELQIVNELKYLGVI